MADVGRITELWRAAADALELPGVVEGTVPSQWLLDEKMRRQRAEAECGLLREQLDAARRHLREGLSIIHASSDHPERLLEGKPSGLDDAWDELKVAYAHVRAALGVEGEPPPAREWPDAVGRCNPTGFNPTASSATWCRCCGAPQGWEPDRG